MRCGGRARPRGMAAKGCIEAGAPSAPGRGCHVRRRAAAGRPPMQAPSMERCRKPATALPASGCQRGPHTPAHAPAPRASQPAPHRVRRQLWLVPLRALRARQGREARPQVRALPHPATERGLPLPGRGAQERLPVPALPHRCAPRAAPRRDVPHPTPPRRAAPRRAPPRRASSAASASRGQEVLVRLAEGVSGARAAGPWVAHRRARPPLKWPNSALQRCCPPERPER